MSRWRFPDRVPLRLRVCFRGVFALLALAMVALALSVRQDKKQRSVSLRQTCMNPIGALDNFVGSTTR
jgi:hypothetical protein